MSAEQAVLGCILRDNRAFKVAADIITGDDFENPSLGAVFDGIGRTIATGKQIDFMTVETYFPEWGVRGISAADPWLWADAGTYPEVVYEFAQVVRLGSLRRRGKQVMSQALSDLNDTSMDPALVLGRVGRELAEAPRTALESLPLQQILQIEDVEDWVIPGLLERKDRLILTGHEGLGKSTFVRQLLIASAGGVHPFTLEKIRPVRSLVIDAENTARQWMRASRWMVNHALRQGRNDPATNVHMALSGRIDILNPLTLAGIHGLIDKHKPDIVFIGPLYRIAVHLNKDEDVAPVIAALDSIRDRDVALVIEAHAGHAIGVNGVRDVRPRGSSALLGWPEFGFGIRKEQEGELFEFVAWRGAREARDWPERLRRGDWQLGDWPWVVSDGW